MTSRDIEAVVIPQNQPETCDTLTESEMPVAWTFEDEGVADKFDGHVREQLPWYDPLSRFVADIAVSFVPRGGIVYDIGASTGNITRLLEDPLVAKGAYAISIEPSKEMARHWSGYGDLEVIPAEKYDFDRDRLPDVSILFLTMMFIEPSKREEFLSRLMEKTKPGGAIIIVDKGFLYSPSAQVACKAATVAEKMRAGTDGRSYMAKELALRGEQRPTDLEEIIRLAEIYGLVSEEIFRFGEFYGVLIIKSSV